MYNMMTIPNTGGMVYLKVKTVNPKSSQHKEKKKHFSYFVSKWHNGC